MRTEVKVVTPRSDNNITNTKAGRDKTSLDIVRRQRKIRREKVKPDNMAGKNFRDRIRRPTSINTNAENQTNAKNVSTPQTNTSTPSPQLTPAGVRGKTDIRSPGVEKSPKNVEDHFPDDEDNDSYPIPDFMTQTDKYGRASTPRTADAIATAHADTNLDKSMEEEPYDNILDSLRMMCCCFLPEEPNVVKNPTDETLNSKNTAPQSTTREAENEKTTIKLLPQLHPKDHGKKCLVLDLDETLVHSSFRAVTGADFVIPVQIEDVVHFVYVAKRPGVDQFLLEMAKHYEIVIYTASLNKYADPLLDLLDIHGVIRTRLFRESCVYYEGNYVKDLSLLDRDLSQSIIIDNSPSSYIFHPENAIDCSSFIDDPKDRELDQIGKFLAGVRDVNDVRDVCSYWKKWPSIPAITGVRYEDEERVLK